MGRARRVEVRPETGKVRERIDRWRQTRKKRSPMPEKLWAAAVALAGRDGVYRISQDLGVNYESLRSRLRQAPKVSRSRPRKPRRARKSASKARASFIELKAAPAAVAMRPPDGDVVVEVQEAAGAQLTIRLGTDATLDVCAVVTAFRSEGRRRRRR